MGQKVGGCCSVVTRLNLAVINWTVITNPNPNPNLNTNNNNKNLKPNINPN